MEKKIRAVQFGCGPIGCHVARLALQRPSVKIVGAVDIAKDKAGKDLGEIIGLKEKLGVVISKDAASTFSATSPDIVVHTTGSHLKDVYEQLKQIVSAGMNVVSTCEELSFPYGENRELSDSLNELAKQNSVTVLGTGINPGFLMDAWPLFMTGVCQEVRMVKATRIQDASGRRLPFQKKIGAGCSFDEFQKRVEAGDLRHVGLSESAAMVARGLGWELDTISERIEPVMADKRVTTPYLTVEVGQAAGVRQVAYGLQKGEARVILEFQAYVGASETYDEVKIAGIPDLTVRTEGATHGDIGTAAVMVNAIPRVVEAPAGLFTMKDMPLVHSYGVI